MDDEETRLIVPPPQNESVATRADAPDAPALTEADQLAIGIVAVLDRIAETIPDLRPPNPESARRVRGGRTVSREFVSSMIALTDVSRKVRDLGTFDSGKARRVLQSRDAYRLISERLAMLLATVNHTIEAQWAEVASAATVTYTIASAMADDRDPDLLPHLKILRAHLNRRGPKGKKKADENPGEE